MVTTQELCGHTIVTGKGQKVLHTYHNMDKNVAADKLLCGFQALLPDQKKALTWLEITKPEKPQNVGDQLIIVKNSMVNLHAQNLDMYRNPIQKTILTGHQISKILSK